jgi:hypothetical protein
LITVPFFAAYIGGALLTQTWFLVALGLAFVLCWMIWGYGMYASDEKNYVQLDPDRLVLVLGGEPVTVPRSNISSFKLNPRSEGLYRGFQWLPTSEHVEVILQKPYGISFRLLQVAGQWSARSLHIEAKDNYAFMAALGRWLYTAPSPSP